MDNSMGEENVWNVGGESAYNPKALPLRGGSAIVGNGVNDWQRGQFR